MECLLEVGVSTDVNIRKVLLDTILHMANHGYSVNVDDIKCEYGLDGEKIPMTNGELVVRPGGIRLLYKEKATSIFISVSQTEIIEGYAVILHPVTVGISTGVGCSIFEKIMTACLAISIASCEGSEIVDMEHVWSDKDVNQIEYFEKQVTKRSNVV